jgi:hypothetical protein
MPFNPDIEVQIDVTDVSGNWATCNLYTGLLCTKILIPRQDYDELTRLGFFIRNGKERDSAGVLNTTPTFKPVQ